MSRAVTQELGEQMMIALRKTSSTTLTVEKSKGIRDQFIKYGTELQKVYPSQKEHVQEKTKDFCMGLG